MLTFGRRLSFKALFRTLMFDALDMPCRMAVTLRRANKSARAWALITKSQHHDFLLFHFLMFNHFVLLKSNNHTEQT